MLNIGRFCVIQFFRLSQINLNKLFASEYFVEKRKWTGVVRTHLTLSRLVELFVYQAQSSFMNNLAIAPPTIPTLTAKQEEILQALVTGMNQTEAAKFVGVSREYVCRLCQKDHFLREIDKRVHRMKTLLAPRALSNVAKLAEEAKSERVRLDANLGILDRSGHGVRDKEIIHMEEDNFVIHIDLS